MATPTTLPAVFVSGNVLTAQQQNDLRGAFRVLQVVSTSKTDTFSSATANAWTDITGMTVSITPSATTSKIFITAAVMAQSAQTGVASRYIRLVRDSTAVGIGDTAGSRISATTTQNVNNDFPGSHVINFLDSPATVSATTYKLQFWQDGTTFYLNRSSSDPNGTNGGRFASSITVMEISA